MKVLQINSVCGIGSTGRIATDIHHLLVEDGHESYIAYGRESIENFNKAIRIGNKLDNYGHVLKTRLLDKHGFGSSKATLEFLKQIDKLNPDIIHLHNIHGYYINVKLLFDYLKNTNKPVIWTLHDCWAFTGHCTHFDFIQCNKWKSNCFSCPQKNNYPNSLLIDNSKINFKIKKEIFNGVKNLKIVTPSEWLAGLVKDSFLKEYPIKVINNGVDLKVFKPTKSDIRKRYNIDGSFIILGVASIWEEKKGINYFIGMSSKLKKDEKIILVGVTKEQKNKLPHNIIAITKTNDIKELAAIYSEADVFVNPTLEDTFPTTNLEALACGTPVVSFKTGGSIETIDSNTGVVVEKGNLNELILGIKQIKEKGKSYYSEKCIERAYSYYNKNEKFNIYIKEYKNSLIKEEKL